MDEKINNFTEDSQTIKSDVQKIEKISLTVDFETQKLKTSISEIKKSQKKFEKLISSLNTTQRKEAESFKVFTETINHELELIKNSIKTPAKIINKNNELEIPSEFYTEGGGEDHNSHQQSYRKILDEHSGKLEELKKLIEKKEKDLAHKIRASCSALENSLKFLKSNYTEDVSVLKEKLSWLPIELNEIRGMGPNEARMFVIEARLRSEENLRNEQFNKLFSMLDTMKVDLKSTSENIMFSHILPNLNNHTFDFSTPEVNNQDIVKRFTDSMISIVSTDRQKLKLPKQNRISMSVDLPKTKNPFRHKYDRH